MSTKSYRGKHPERINEVSTIIGRAGVFVRLNDRTKWMIYSASHVGASRIPRCGDELSAFRNVNYRVETFVAPSAEELKAARDKFIVDVIANFKRHNSDWKPEHGRNELRNVLVHLFDEKQLRLTMTINSATRILADFIS